MPKYSIKQVGPRRWLWVCRDVTHPPQEGEAPTFGDAVRQLTHAAETYQGRTIRFDDIHIEREGKRALSATPVSDDKWMSEASLSELLDAIRARTDGGLYIVKAPTNPDDDGPHAGQPGSESMKVMWDAWGNMADMALLRDMLTIRTYAIINTKFPVCPEEPPHGHPPTE